MFDKIETPKQDDLWSDWLLHRDGGDAAYGTQLRKSLEVMRDQVLDNARLQNGQTLLDIGSGDGLIAFGAIERVGRTLKAICTDISVPMLEHTKRLAQASGFAGQCVFQACSASDLKDIWDQSVDVVTSRAALAFVEDKPAAFGEFFRVLKPGGRISFCEPILQDKSFELMALQRFLAANPSHPGATRMRLAHRLLSAQYPATETEVAANPLTNFSERDLVALACDAGFVEVQLRLHIDVQPGLIRSWQVFLNTSPHPWAPRSSEVLARAFNDEERRQFEELMRPSIEAGHGVTKDSFAYLTAMKPAGV